MAQGFAVTRTSPATVATPSNVPASITSVTVLVLNTVRKGAIVVNDSAEIMYLKFGTGASPTSYTALLAPGDYYEVPYQYTGLLAGIWVGATGAARVTELT